MDYPAVIIRIKEVLPPMWIKRTQLQKDLVALGDGNEEETKDKAWLAGFYMCALFHLISLHAF